MLREADIASFFLEGRSIDPEAHLILEYSFMTNENPRWVAASLCAEQSTAQWARVGVVEDLRVRFAAKVIELDTHRRPYVVRIAHPVINIQPNVASLLSAVMGEGALYCPGIELIRLRDIGFPKKFLEAFPGPQFGLQGVRSQLGVHDRPLFIGVVKPNLGLVPADFAALAEAAWLGGLDIAKDDEMLVDPPYSPFCQRMECTGQARLRAEQVTGRPKMMIANLTGDECQVYPRYQDGVSRGINAFMLNGVFTGFSAIRGLRQQSAHPIMCHFTGLALYHRVPNFGIDSRVLVKLMRLSGSDMIGLPGFGTRMHGSSEEVLDNIQACLAPWGSIKPALPIPGGSDWAGSLKKVHDLIGHVDFGFIAGRGIFGHPAGPNAGARSLHEAWQIIKNGGDPMKDAGSGTALAQAVEAFA